eukprot:TRINITY_DN427_c0_g1_i1.p1 TRINITY_DN427_c0_g1~~TRINITY_DN427_c0_g1_i1.p1  ORF type:complete len:206 (-),score=45.49 TRINITY_DN427_c0_g1_i1:70-687(-)
MESSSGINFYYFGIRARGQLTVLALEQGNVPYTWTRQFEWPGSLKAETPFGQLPYLVDGDVKVAQSMATARYAARKGNLLGSNDAEFAASEQLVEEHNDIFSLITDAAHSSDKAAGYNTAFTKFPAHLTAVEKLLGDKDYITGASSPLLGDLAIWSVLNIALDLEPEVLANFPKLKAFYARVSALPKIDAYIKANYPQYFKRPSN